MKSTGQLDEVEAKIVHFNKKNIHIYYSTRYIFWYIIESFIRSTMNFNKKNSYVFIKDSQTSNIGVLGTPKVITGGKSIFTESRLMFYCFI